MGQDDVLNYLEKHPGEKYGPTEIAEELGKTKPTVQPQLKTLYKRGMVEKDTHGKYWVPLRRTSDHALRVASGMLALIKRGRYRVKGELWPDRKYIPNALMHLKREYPGIYNKCKKKREGKDYLNILSQLEKEITPTATKLSDGTRSLKRRGCFDCGASLKDEEQKEINELADYFT